MKREGEYLGTECKPGINSKEYSRNCFCPHTQAIKRKRKEKTYLMLFVVIPQNGSVRELEKGFLGTHDKMNLK